MKNAVVSWSGGKDSAFAVYELLKSNIISIKGLLAATSAASGRLPVHEVQRDLLYEQANSLGISLYEVKLPENPGNDIYEAMFSQQFSELKKRSIHTVVYADLFLEDIKEYRDQLLFKSGMAGYYPLWKRDTAEVASDFISAGFEAIVTTVDTAKLPAELAGRRFDEKFIRSLPDGVDPCGENGEFHTFVVDGPCFSYPIPIERGEIFKTVEGRFVHVELNKK